MLEPATQKFIYHRLTNTGLDISSFAEDADDRPWVGTEGDGLFCRETTFKLWCFGSAEGLPSDYMYNIVPRPGTTGPCLLLVLLLTGAAAHAQ